MEKYFHYILFLVPVLFFSCATTSGLRYSEEQLEEFRDEKDDVFNSSISQEDCGSESYVFLRLYDITYDKKTRPGNFLRGVIKSMGRAANGNYYVHSAVSTSLEDNSFLGLTLGGKNAAKYESVMDVKNNEFMSTNNPYLSRCTVVAVPCTEIDREELGLILEFAGASDQKFRYGIITNAGVPFSRAGNRRRKNRKNKMESAETADVAVASDVFKKKRTYVCSTFVSFVLDRSIDSIHNEYKKNKTNSYGVTPVDLYSLPGSFELFDCRYINYDRALSKFIEMYPVFAKFLKK